MQVCACENGERMVLTGFRGWIGQQALEDGRDSGEVVLRQKADTRQGALWGSGHDERSCWNLHFFLTCRAAPAAAVAALAAGGGAAAPPTPRASSAQSPKTPAAVPAASAAASAVAPAAEAPSQHPHHTQPSLRAQEHRWKPQSCCCCCCCCCQAARAPHSLAPASTPPTQGPPAPPSTTLPRAARGTRAAPTVCTAGGWAGWGPPAASPHCAPSPPPLGGTRGPSPNGPAPTRTWAAQPAALSIGTPPGGSAAAAAWHAASCGWGAYVGSRRTTAPEQMQDGMQKGGGTASAPMRTSKHSTHAQVHTGHPCTSPYTAPMRNFIHSTHARAYPKRHSEKMKRWQDGCRLRGSSLRDTSPTIPISSLHHHFQPWQKS
eukprot:1153931-Pelagomonas_calceolata.AAC.4